MRVTRVAGFAAEGEVDADRAADGEEALVDRGEVGRVEAAGHVRCFIHAGQGR